VPLGDTPILEVVLRQLQRHGFNDVVLAVNHLAKLIIAFFGNGRKLNLNICYSVEDEPLGTVGPLTRVNNLDDNFLVMNGDLLTTINYKDLFNYHLRNKNDITIAVHQKTVDIDLGVLEIENGNFMRYIEKPVYHFNVSTGIYIFNKNVLGLIPKNKKMDMPSFISKAKRCGKKIKCYRRNYYWLDIGRPGDYEKAVEVFKNKKKLFLP